MTECTGWHGAWLHHPGHSGHQVQGVMCHWVSLAVMLVCNSISHYALCPQFQNGSTEPPRGLLAVCRGPGPGQQHRGPQPPQPQGLRQQVNIVSCNVVNTPIVKTLLQHINAIQPMKVPTVQSVIVCLFVCVTCPHVFLIPDS